MGAWILRVPVPSLRAGCIAAVLVLATALSCTNLDDLTAPDCAFTVAPTSISVTNTGGSGTLAIQAPGVCPWTVENESGWVSLSGEPSGKGNATIGYAVAAHEGFDFRYATLTVAGKSVSVAQAGRPLPVCNYSASPMSVSIGAAGGTGSIGVSAGPNCVWTAGSPTPWITISSGVSGSGNGAFGYTVAANTAAAARTGSMAFMGSTIAVSQAGTTAPPPNCNYSISPTSADVPAAGVTGTINVTAQAGCPWTAVSQQTWIVIISGASGSGNGQVRYTVAPCTCNQDRNGRIVVAGRNFDIRQDSPGDNTPSGVQPVGR